jgi:hypothetical protein
MRLVRFRLLDLSVRLIVYWIAGCREADVDGTPFARCRLITFLGRNGFCGQGFAGPNHELAWPR